MLFNKDMILCILLLVWLSNNGICFYNYFYEVFGFNWIYKVFVLIDFVQVIVGVCGFGICGCVIFMLYKEDVIVFVDWMDVLVSVIDLVNMIVNDVGVFIVYNIDYFVIVQLIEYVGFDLVVLVLLCGLGGMVKVIVVVFCDVGFV